jgi:hypothetical protein
MTDVTIHDDESPEGRAATDEEINDLLNSRGSAVTALDILAGLTAADGTSYLDIFNDTRDLD